MLGKAAITFLAGGMLVCLMGQQAPPWQISLERARESQRSGGIDAEQAYRTAEAEARGQDDGGEALAVVHTFLGGFYLDQGKYPAAEPLLRQSLAVQLRNPHTEPGGLALTLHSLSVICRDTARYAEAESLQLKAIGTIEASFGSKHAHLAPYLNALGRLHLEVGRLPEAEQVFQRALAIGEACCGGTSPYMGESLNGLAEVYIQHGDARSARQASLRALQIVEHAFGPDHFEVGRSLDQLARAYFALQRYHEAREAWQRSLKIKERWLGPDHDDTLTVLTGLGDVARIEGRFEEAEKLVRRAVNSAEDRRESALLAVSLHHLAVIYAARKKHSEADPLFRRSLAITENVLGTSNPELASCLSDYAQSLFAAGNFRAADTGYGRAISLMEQTGGSNSLWLPPLLEDHGRVLRKLNRKPEAELLEARARLLRASNPGTGQTVDVTTLKPDRK